MGAFFKVSGTYKETAPYVKVSGNWKFAKEAWTKVSGSWKQFFLSLGTNDSSFNVADNIGGFGGTVNAIAIQSNGKIVAGGIFITYNGVTSNRIARLNTDGTRDTDFTTAIGTGFNASVDAIATQSDEKIVVVGAFTTHNGVTSNRIARLNTDGTRDTDFTTAIGTGFNASVDAIAIQSDGKIVVGGSFTAYNGETSNNIARLNTDGSIDTAFTTNIGTGFGSFVNAIAIQSDGKIVVGGAFSTHNGVSSNLIARLNADGTRDTAFTTAISNKFLPVSSIKSLVIEPDQSIVLGMANSMATFDGVLFGRILRIKNDLTVDSDFFGQNIKGFDSTVKGIAIQSDEKIVVGGNFRTHNGVTSNSIARLNTDGTRDTAFTTAIGIGFNNSVLALKIQSDGKIVAGGNFTTYNGVTSNRIARLNTDGTRDTAFTTATGTGLNNVVQATVIQLDGKIVVGGGFTTHNGVSSNRIARLNADGTRDTDFTTAIGTGFSGTVYSIAIQADGKIVVGGFFTTHNGVTSNRIARLNADGTLDTDFTTAIGTGFSSFVNAIAIQSDGKIVAGGGFTTFNGVSSNRMARLNADGTRDTAFTTAIGTGFIASVDAIAIQSDGKIVVGGAFSTHNGVSSSRIARLNADGTRDTAFTTNIGTGFNRTVNAIAIQSDGKIVAGGEFQVFNNKNRNGIARLGADLSS
jgi:uncharacterized delta-60 repeat protein